MKSMMKIAGLGALALSLSACVIAVGDTDNWDDDDYVHATDRSVKIPLDGDRRVEFACPRGYEVFTRSDGDDGTEEYGCRRAED